MPIEHSKSEAAFKHNVAAEIDSGRPRDQALAIAYRIKREGRAMGGRSAKAPPHSGPIASAVAGRTDHHPMAVKSGAYVLPAETVSHLGENNSANGLAVAEAMFGASGPYGMGKNPAIKRGSGAPRAPKRKAFAEGGGLDTFASLESPPMQEADPVEINAAGGEYVIDPDVVAAIGGGDLDAGHQLLDAWVLARRKDHIRTLRKLPGPAKS